MGVLIFKGIVGIEKQLFNFMGWGERTKDPSPLHLHFKLIVGEAVDTLLPFLDDSTFP